MSCFEQQPRSQESEGDIDVDIGTPSRRGACGTARGPCIVVIFGASGDLTKRKLIQALYNLVSHNLLPEAFAVVGVDRAEGIEMTFGAKVPGPAMRLGNVHMDFCYSDYFGGAPGTGYESLIYDCMNGEAQAAAYAASRLRAWIVEGLVTAVLHPSDAGQVLK